MKTFLLHFSYLFVLIPLITSGSSPIILTDKNQGFQFAGEYIDILEDPSGKLTLKDITGSFSSGFITGKPEEISNNSNYKSTYWIRMVVENQSKKEWNWILELYDYKIDQYEFYLPDATGKYSVYKGGFSYPFNNRSFTHKNFIHDLHGLKGGKKTFYIKIKAFRKIAFFGIIRTVQKFIAYSTIEYFLLSLFYGVVAAMIVYNIFLFISTKESAYLYYVISVASC